MHELSRYILALIAIAIIIGLFILVATRAIGWARRGSPAATFIGWALLLLSAGMNPQPPPQEQVEEANRQKKIKKVSESGPNHT